MTQVINRQICRPALLNGNGQARLGDSFSNQLQNSLVPQRSNGSATPTFTRATTAYQTDWEGKQNLVLSEEARFQGARRVENLFDRTEDLTNAYWTKYETTATSAVALTETTANDLHLVTRSGTTTGANDGTFIYSAKVKAGIRSYIKITNGDSPAFSAVFNVSSPAVVSTSGATTGAGITATADADGYYRITVKWTKSTGANQRVQQQIGFDATTFSYAGSTAGIALYLKEQQVENATGQSTQVLSEYVSKNVLSAPYHGANVDGVKYFSTLNGNTVASNVVTEATGAAINSSASGVSTAWVDASGPFGYLAEGARADVLGTTAAIRRTMTDVGWVNTTMTVGSATGVDGVASAGASLTAAGANSTSLFTTVLASAARTYSVWARRKTGTGTVQITDNNGTNWTTITLTSAYQQFQITRTQANPVVGFRIVTSGDAIEVDFNTIEAASIANPTPIPVNVSKNADELSYVFNGNASDTVGSSYCEYTTAWAFGFVNPRALGLSGNAGGSALLIVGASTLQTRDGTAFRAISTSALSGPQTTPKKIASAWSGSSVSGAVAGGNLATATFDGSYDTAGGTIKIGWGDTPGVSTNTLYGTIRNVRIYQHALSSGMLQVLTT